MPSVFATFAAPVARRAIGWAKETTPGTAVMPTFTLPMKTFTPVDKYTRLEDDAWRQSMAGLFNLIDGVRISDLSMGGPFFADGCGYPLLATMGDYWQSVNGTAGTATTLSSAYTAGGTTISTAASTGITTGTTIAVGALASTAEEVRTVTAVTGSGPYTVTLSSPMYQNHASAVAVTPYSAVTTYTHNFSLLNSGAGAGGIGTGQPPVYTLTDNTGLGGSNNSIGARQYAYSAFSEMTLTGTSTALLMWDAKATALASALAASAPTVSTTTVKPQASWLSTVTLGGTQEYNSSEWKITLSRKESPYFTNSGQQDPFIIGRGVFTANLAFNWDPAVDETEFLMYLQNTQPTVAITASNGLTGAAAASITISANQVGFSSGQITDSKELFGYQTGGPCVANATNAGPSGGLSPLSIALTNAVVSY